MKQKAEIETDLVIAETKRGNFSMYLKAIETFLCFLIIKALCFIYCIK